MKRLWTPWRMEHILDDTASSCLFEPPGSSTHAREHLLLFRNEDAVCLLNRFPYTNGHLLIAPARHVGCITKLDSKETAHVMALVKEATRILKRHLAPDGFNIGLNLGSEAGAGIADHLHFHIVPRWSGDHNFMTVLAGVRAIPEHLEATFDKLLPDFQNLQNK
ncbi:MAG: HIT family hydrolase [Desulfobacterales bacterium]|nr:MAG: HIT family hydrolase [Desulfobacterales bacterium]